MTDANNEWRFLKILTITKTFYLAMIQAKERICISKFIVGGK